MTSILTLLAFLTCSNSAACTQSFLAAQDTGADTSRSEIDGIWKLVEFYEDGRDREDVVNQNYVINRSKGTQTITKDGELFSKMTFRLDTSTSPKQIVFVDGEDRGLGIYEVSDGRMRLAIYADPAKAAIDRPTSFDEIGAVHVAVYELEEN